MAVILGTSFGDTLIGTTEDDFLFGDGGSDTLAGASGNDTLIGGLGLDRMWGGPGADVFQGAILTWTNDQLADFASEDLLVITGVHLVPQQLFIGGRPGPGGLVSVRIDANLDGSILYGTDAYFYIQPQGAPFTFQITHVGQDSHLALRPATGETITGDAGDNLLTGGDGNDTLIGLAGNDTLDGGAGTNRLEGGPGNDLYLLRYGLSEIVEIEGEGRDRIAFTGHVLTLPDNVEEATLFLPEGSDPGYGSVEGNGLDNAILLDEGIVTDFYEILGYGGDDTLVGAQGDDNIYGGDGDDSLLGAAGDDWLRGGNGADTLVGGAGDDWLIGGETDPEVTYGSYGADLADQIYGMEGDDWIDGATGNDLLYGGAGQDTMSGGTGADTLAGQQDNDTLAGGQGSDLIFGNDGDDYINGGYGYDRLNGGAGADSFVLHWDQGHATDWVQDYAAAEGDRLVFLPRGPSVSPADFQVNYAHTPGAGDAEVAEAFIIFRPTGQIRWALVDGAGQDSITLSIGGQVFDLLA